jgi:ubiquinone/menaquinone biosynthesis C-methylase UbiE
LTDGRRIEVSTRTTEEQKREEIEAALARKRYEMAAALEEAIASRREYDSVWHATYARYQNSVMLSLLPKGPTATVLDLGCGVGVLLQDMVGRYIYVHGLDVSAESLSLVGIDSPNLRGLVVGDGEHLPYRSGVFDAVALKGVLHHIPNVDQALRELHRVLKPGGTLLLVEPCGDHALIRWGRGCLSKRKERYFQSTELDAYLRRHGFTPLILRRTGYVAFAFSYLLRARLAKLARPAWFYRSCVKFLILLDEALSVIPTVKSLNLGIIVVGKGVE